MTAEERAAANAAQIQRGDRQHPQYQSRGYHGQDWIRLYRTARRLADQAAALKRAITAARQAIPDIAPQWQPDRYEDARRLLEDAQATAELLVETIAAATIQAYKNTPTEWQREHRQQYANIVQRYYDAITAAPHD